MTFLRPLRALVAGVRGASFSGRINGKKVLPRLPRPIQHRCFLDSRLVLLIFTLFERIREVHPNEWLDRLGLTRRLCIAISRGTGRHSPGLGRRPVSWGLALAADAHLD